MRPFLVATLVLVVCFALPLYQLVRFALASDLYSHVILLPLVSAYLIRQQPVSRDPTGEPLPKIWAFILLIAGLAVGGWYLSIALSAVEHVPQNELALAMYSFVLLFWGLACWFLKRQTLRELAFPLGYLIFMAPFPLAVEAGLETLLQHGSAYAAHAMLELTGMPVMRTGTAFRLPGFSMEVAPECSGIRSTLALFLVSLIAGQLFLRSPWRRAVLAAAVLPLALLRNGLRVFTIGELCVRIGPEMIESWIHRRGGPVFFLLSLIPFSLILYFLWKSDRSRSRPPSSS